MPGYINLDISAPGTSQANRDAFRRGDINIDQLRATVGLPPTIVEGGGAFSDLVGNPVVLVAGGIATAGIADVALAPAETATETLTAPVGTNIVEGGNVGLPDFTGPDFVQSGASFDTPTVGVNDAGAFDTGGSSGVFDASGNPIYTPPAVDTPLKVNDVLNTIKTGASTLFAIKSGQAMLNGAKQIQQNRQQGQVPVSAVYGPAWGRPGSGIGGAFGNALNSGAGFSSNLILLGVAGLLLIVFFLVRK